jgi:hypothetical protein
MTERLEGKGAAWDGEAQFEFLAVDWVILSAAVFQAERRISHIYAL